MSWDSNGDDSVLRVESGTNNFNAEFCVEVGSAFNTIRRSPPTAGRPPPGTECDAAELILCDRTLLSMAGDSSNGVAEAGATRSGISDSDFICLPREPRLSEASHSHRYRVSAPKVSIRTLECT